MVRELLVHAWMIGGLCTAVKIKCTPLQQELYRTYLLIQDIDPNSRLSERDRLVERSG